MPIYFSSLRTSQKHVITLLIPWTSADSPTLAMSSSSLRHSRTGIHSPHTLPNWVVSCGRAHARDWKEKALKDAALGASLGALLPALPTTSPPNSSSSLTITPSVLSSALSVLARPIVASNVTSIFMCSPRLPSSLDEFDRRRPLKVMLSEARSWRLTWESKMHGCA
ncbi:MAG: hypothetical protein J3R72DRAFT_425503 [Linnemannia gamsii]|nr:MAG: hypothetical protein J3R72DRAFT_425503 [Linnemannia gamsii]